MINFFTQSVNHGFNTHSVCCIFQSVCVLLQVGVVSPLLLNASLLLVLTIDYSDWLVQVTELIDKLTMTVIWVLTTVWLNNIELTD